jgi:hypothetical protein
MMELKGREYIINTPLHLLQHSKGICKKEWLCIYKFRNGVREYDGVPS